MDWVAAEIVSFPKQINENVVERLCKFLLISIIHKS